MGITTPTIHHGENAAELYFETPDLDAFINRLQASEFEITYLTPPTEMPGGRKVVRFYDPDKNLIEVATAGS